MVSGILLSKCFSNLNMGIPREVKKYNGSTQSHKINNRDMAVSLESQLSLWLSNLNSYLYMYSFTQ